MATNQPPDQTPTERGFDEGHALTVEAMQNALARLGPEVRDKCIRRAIAYIQPNYTKEALDDLLHYYNNHCMEASFRERVEHLAWIFADERADTERERDQLWQAEVEAARESACKAVRDYMEAHYPETSMNQHYRSLSFNLCDAIRSLKQQKP
jgi:hypothetical protein